MKNLSVPTDSSSADVPAVLLVGGFGTRLRSVLPDVPKPLARVGEIPFLELLIVQLKSQGIRRLVMCTGHRAEQIEEACGDGRKWDLAIEYSRESVPLGTAGAVKLAESLLGESQQFLVLNGDSFLEFDFSQLRRFHVQHGALATIAVRDVPDASRYGAVQLGENMKIVGFAEKNNSGAPGTVNGGIYLFQRAALQFFPAGPASLEKDIFPRLIEQGMYAATQTGVFIDIGTPDDYARAQALYQTLCDAAHSARD